MVERNSKDEASTFIVNKVVLGHEDTRKYLQNRLNDEHLPHALLFEGPQGIGKATLAFHLAYHLLKADNPKMNMENFWRGPQDENSLWNMMEQGAHPGLIYIQLGKDPKNGRLRNAITVEDIRRVNQYLQKTAADKSWRIIIIDAADDMNRNAANALLKTLEEPPAKSLFFLISHNSGKLLPTIRSRCQWMRFKSLPDEIMFKILEKITQIYDFNCDNKRIKEIIHVADGSVYRALVLLAADGIKIVEMFNEIIKNPIFQTPKAHKLADNLSKRDNNDTYQMFLSYLIDFMHQEARSAAHFNNLSQASYWADHSQKQEKVIQEAQSYNLDKKQFILVLLQKIHKIYQETAVRN